MNLFYMLVILIGSSCGKVLIQNEDVHVTNDISNDDSTLNVTAPKVVLHDDDDHVTTDISNDDSTLNITVPKVVIHNDDDHVTTDISKDDSMLNVTVPKVVIHDDDDHVKNDISKDDSELNVTVPKVVQHDNDVNVTNDISKDDSTLNITVPKVVIHDDDDHVTNDISKDDSTSNVTEPNTTITTEATLTQNTIEDNIDEHAKVSNDDLVIATTSVAIKPNATEIETRINGLDNDFLIIISGDNKMVDPTPIVQASKVDNGTALLLTPFIKEGRIAEARNGCSVDPELFLGFESYSGFLTVDETLKSHLFFWYFPALKQPVNETPWIVWLQGGPGASSMTGLFDEIGPINISPFGTLRSNRHSWIQNHSLLFIDNPVGTGYSFTECSNGFTKDLETYGTHLHTAMKQFIQIFPELQAAPLFVAGESYAGKYVPALASKIHRHRDRPGPHFNLQGVILGNALVDPDVISTIANPFQYFGLMDETQLGYIKPLVDGFQYDIAHNRSVQAKSKWVSLITSLLVLSNQKHAYNFLQDDLVVGKYSAYLARSEVKRALHVGDIKFNYLNVTVNMKLAPDFLSNTTPLMEELLDHYRVLVYCGQLDQMLPCLYTSKNYRTWKWNGTQEFLEAVRYPYLFNGRNAGYHKTGGRLSEVVFRGAGHMVPLDAPAPAQVLVARFTHGKPLGPRSPVYEKMLHEIKTYLKVHSNSTNENAVVNF